MIFESIYVFLTKILFFTAYVNDKGSFPKPLDPEEEAKYLALAHAGDMEARDVLIRRNLRLVAHVVKKYNNAAEVDDMISVGSIGLIKAVNTFSPDKGTQLVTYAAKCIDNEILMYIRANKKHRLTMSLQDSMGTDREGNEITLMELLPAKGESISDEVETKVMVERITRLVQEVLPPRDAKIICMRYGIGTEPRTQREVAVLLGISRSYISRIEKKALAMIRESL
ncbi:MAG: RNA polymerase sporulation sigma factor SigK [Clostridiales bacterium]|jgi:RNA polymerase sporulation-specific sigma factor|nr:RNA polymerase sporulation sigma factor SigK [Clostridiales bacterium]